MDWGKKEFQNQILKKQYDSICEPMRKMIFSNLFMVIKIFNKDTYAYKFIFIMSAYMFTSYS